MTDTAKIIKIALGSAVLGWLLASLLLGLCAFVGTQDYDDRAWALALSAVIVLGALPTVLISTATLGVVWHQHVSKRDLTKNQDYWLPGMILGGLVAAVVPFVTLPGMNSSWLPLIAIGTLYGAVCGALVGLFAWQMLRRDQETLRAASERTVVAGAATLSEASPSEPFESTLRQDPLHRWTRIVTMGFAILTVTLALWVTLMSPH